VFVSLSDGVRLVPPVADAGASEVIAAAGAGAVEVAADAVGGELSVIAANKHWPLAINSAPQIAAGTRARGNIVFMGVYFVRM
jgi:hypothetical protein